MNLNKILTKLILVLFLLGQFTSLSLLFPKKADTAGALTDASATLGNSRLSYYGAVSGAHTAGMTTITTKSSGSYGDLDTTHLFPGDTVSVGPNGNKTVGSISGANVFALASGITVGASDGDAVYATQSSTLVVVTTITNDIPASGYIKVTLPDPASNGNDGAPNTANSVSDNGFDLNGMAAADVATTGGTGCSWGGTETLTAGSGAGHIYKQVTTTVCTAGAITVTFDGASKDLVNPAPVYTGHTQGVADVYTIAVGTYDSGNNPIDTVDVVVAFIEGVLVSATVEESLSFTVASVGVGATACNQPADVTSTAASVPFGALNSTIGVASFKDLAHDLEITTNADDGYSVTVSANDQMGLNGGVCTADAGEANNCIPDTTCDGDTCTHLLAAVDDWETATEYGFGYALESSDGSDAAWEYDGTSGTCDGAGTDFCAAQFADTEAGGEPAQEIMSNSGPVNSSNIFVCYRINVSVTQPAGYYYNKLTYIATATF